MLETLKSAPHPPLLPTNLCLVSNHFYIQRNVYRHNDLSVDWVQKRTMNESNLEASMNSPSVKFLPFTAHLLWLLPQCQRLRWVTGGCCLQRCCPPGCSSWPQYLCHEDGSQLANRKHVSLKKREQKQCNYCCSKSWWTFEAITSLSYLDPNCDFPYISTIWNV